MCIPSPLFAPPAAELSGGQRHGARACCRWRTSLQAAGRTGTRSWRSGRARMKSPTLRLCTPTHRPAKSGWADSTWLYRAVRRIYRSQTQLLVLRGRTAKQVGSRLLGVTAAGWRRFAHRRLRGCIRNLLWGLDAVAAKRPGTALAMGTNCTVVDTLLNTLANPECAFTSLCSKSEHVCILT